jgi:hypothetical protein
VAGWFEEYQVQVIEVTADLGDIIELFVRINSTGNALTPQEQRPVLPPPFLKEAARLASRYEDYLQNIGTIGLQQTRRMKHVEPSLSTPQT